MNRSEGKQYDIVYLVLRIVNMAYSLAFDSVSKALKTQS